ncbi:unnamed protein product [Discosporangium mesarthrocarpum]
MVTLLRHSIPSSSSASSSLSFPSTAGGGVNEYHHKSNGKGNYHYHHFHHHGSSSSGGGEGEGVLHRLVTQADQAAQAVPGGEAQAVHGMEDKEKGVEAGGYKGRGRGGTEAGAEAEAEAKADGTTTGRVVVDSCLDQGWPLQEVLQPLLSLLMAEEAGACVGLALLNARRRGQGHTAESDTASTGAVVGAEKACPRAEETEQERGHTAEDEEFLQRLTERIEGNPRALVLAERSCRDILLPMRFAPLPLLLEQQPQRQERGSSFPTSDNNSNNGDNKAGGKAVMDSAHMGDGDGSGNDGEGGRAGAGGNEPQPKEKIEDDAEEGVARVGHGQGQGHGGPAGGGGALGMPMGLTEVVVVEEPWRALCLWSSLFVKTSWENGGLFDAASVVLFDVEVDDSKEDEDEEDEEESYQNYQDREGGLQGHRKHHHPQQPQRHQREQQGRGRPMTPDELEDGYAGEIDEDDLRGISVMGGGSISGGNGRTPPVYREGNLSLSSGGSCSTLGDGCEEECVDASGQV